MTLDAVSKSKYVWTPYILALEQEMEAADSIDRTRSDSDEIERLGRTWTPTLGLSVLGRLTHSGVMRRDCLANSNGLDQIWTK